jgi:ABC-type bacteriocin/lantibiotic exporter with double-glycine peptidase domain
VACLRSILAQHGIIVAEQTLEPVTKKAAGGVDIECLADAARHYGLDTEVVELDLDAIAWHIARDEFPIVYLNRAYFVRSVVARRVALREFIPHAVTPFASRLIS